VLRPVQADFRELRAHPATTSEFKQFEFFDLTGSLGSPAEPAQQRGGFTDRRRQADPLGIRTGQGIDAV